MKKIFVTVAAAFALALTGCGSSGDSSQPEESHKYVIGEDCPADFEQWQCDDFNQMRENMEKDQEEATKVAVPTPTKEPIDPNKIYVGEFDESDDYTNISIASIVNYDDGTGIVLEQAEAFAHEGVGCTESDDPCYVVLRLGVDNWDSSNDFDPATDPRANPVIDYVNTSGETVTVKPSKQALDNSSFAENNDGDSFGVVEADDEGEWYYGFRLDNFKNVEDRSYVAYFEDDGSDKKWIQEDIDF